MPTHQEDILALDVSVHHILLVEVLNSFEDLESELPNLAFRHVFVFCFFGFDKVGEIAQLGILHHNAEVAIVEERALVLDDAWVS